jgi:hypothetical protein
MGMLSGGLLTATVPPIGVSIGFGVVGAVFGVVVSFSLAWFVRLSASWVLFGVVIVFLGLPHPEQAGHRGFIVLPYPERGKAVFASGLGINDANGFSPLVEFQPFFLKGNDEVVGGSRCLEYLVDTGLDVFLAGGLSPPFLHLLFGLGGFESFLSFGLFLSRLLRVDGSLGKFGIFLPNELFHVLLDGRKGFFAQSFPLVGSNSVGTQANVQMDMLCVGMHHAERHLMGGSSRDVFPSDFSEYFNDFLLSEK